MSPPPALPTNVVRFRRPSSPFPSRMELGGFLDAVYAARALMVPADDLPAKRMATRSLILGFVEVDEVLPDGALRRLRASETLAAVPDRAWQVSRRSAREQAAGIA